MSRARPSIPSLLAKADDLLVQCDYPLARQFLERIVSRSDASVAERNHAREMLAVALLELGDLDAAKQIFFALVAEAPRPAAHLYLAQLCDDDPHTALGHYQSAVDMLRPQLDGGDDEETKSNLVCAYLAMVEIWMDPAHDLCVDPAASATCDALLARALELDPQNLEALQTLASVRLSQEQPDAALRALRTFPPQPQSGEVEAEAHAAALLGALPVPTRVARAKLLLECGAHADALALLEGVLAADDAHVEAWYLMGWAWWLRAERRREQGGDGEAEPLPGWEDMARDAKECLETCRGLHSAQGCSDVPLLEHVQELLGVLDALGIEASPADGEDGAGGWSDSDGDVDMS